MSNREGIVWLRHTAWENVHTHGFRKSRISGKTVQSWFVNRQLLPGLLFAAALLVAAVLGTYTTHPGVHLAGVVVLLDVLWWHQRRQFRVGPATWIVLGIIHLAGFLTIAWGTDAVELWVTGVFGLFALFLLLPELWTQRRA